MFVSVPNSQEEYMYGIQELEKFAVQNGVIMAYSSYVNKEAVAYIQANYYHWFVLIPDEKIAEGFHTEDEFNQYIQRSEEHTSELQSLAYLVCRLLLEKKKQKK